MLDYNEPVNIGDSSDLTYQIFKEIPTKQELLLIDALLFAVYGWNPNKVEKISVVSLRRWIEFAKKKMTWGDAYKLRKLLEPKKKSLWKKIVLKIKS